MPLTFEKTGLLPETKCPILHVPFSTLKPNLQTIVENFNSITLLLLVYNNQLILSTKVC